MFTVCNIGFDTFYYIITKGPLHSSFPLIFTSKMSKCWLVGVEATSKLETVSELIKGLILSNKLKIHAFSHISDNRYQT